jgi:hypothetical protein
MIVVKQIMESNYLHLLHTMSISSIYKYSWKQHTSKKIQLRRFYNAQNLSYNNVEVPCEKLFVIMHDLGKENFKRYSSIHLWINQHAFGENQHILKIMKTCLERLQKPFSFTCFKYY